MNLEDKTRVLLFIDKTKQGLPLQQCGSIGDLIRKYKYFSSYYKEYVKIYEDKDKTYTYMVTFTIDPKKHNVNDIKLHDEIENYVIDYALARKPIRCDYVKEGTDEDHKHTHFHLGLETKKYIDFSNSLKFFNKKFGNTDISRSYSNIYNNVLIYINKSIQSTKIAIL